MRRERELTAGDAALVAAVAEVLAVPRAGPPDSFVLHAPLELAARCLLLRRVGEAAHAEASARIAEIATRWQRYPAVEVSGSVGSDEAAPPDQPLDAWLFDRIAAGDVEGADAAWLALSARLDTAALAALVAPAVVDSLAAAAHAAIWVDLAPRALPPESRPGRLARGVVRELAAQPSLRLSWMDGPRAAPSPAAADALRDALAAPPSPGPLDTDFIAPTMMLVEASGMASALLDAPTAGMTVPVAGRVLRRLAAEAMVQEPLTHAPYGWTHCLTLPAATLAIAETAKQPDRAVAVAATHVLGFRATLGTVRLDPAWAPAVSRTGSAAQLPDDPDDATAVVWHAPAEERPSLVQAVVDLAAVEPDAHLAKYVVACLEAAAADPDAAALFHAAAARLAVAWRATAGEGWRW